MNRAQQLLEEVFEARRKKPVPAQPAAPEPAPLMNPKEMEDFALTALGWGDVIRLRGYAERGLYVSGKLTRRDHHYVHENTVSFDLEVCDMDSFTDEEQAEIEKAANEVEERVQKEVRTTSKKIYRALEKEWDWRNADEQVDEDIRANDYDFDENGERDDDGGFKFDQLDDSAKEKAREWMKEGNTQDNFWSEHIIDEWKEELDKMGFPDADISWSGFWSQGDGASFTSSGFDLDKFAHFFMSGYAEERGHPYSDEKYEGQPGPMRESEEYGDFGIDLNAFTQDVIYNDFNSFAQYDPQHENWSKPGEKHYLAQKMADDAKFFVRLNIFDGMPDPEKKGYASVELVAQGWQSHGGQRRLNGNVKRKVRFFIPPGYKSKLISMLIAYWNNACGVADRRNAQGEPPDPQKMCRSLSWHLSRLSSIWRQETELEYHTHLKDAAEKWAAEHPEELAAYRKKLDDWAKKHPEPSPEKLELRHAMKQWKKEKDAAAAAAVPPPQQESEDEDFLNSMGDVAARGAVNIGNFMLDQPVRYMSGAEHYNWSKTTSCWKWKVDVDAYVYSDQLPEQPWDVHVRVHSCTHNMRARRLERQFHTEAEKNFFGINLQKFIRQMQEIVDRGWDDDIEQLLREIEIAFNSTMVPRGPGRKISTFHSDY